MATSLPSLSDDDINTGVYRSLRIGGRSNGVHYDCAALFCARYQLRGVSPEEGDDRNALFEANREALFLRKIEIKVHPKRPRRQSTRLTNLSSHRVGVCEPKHQHTKSACIAHGGCEGRTDCTPHRCLNNRQFDPQSRT